MVGDGSWGAASERLETAVPDHGQVQRDKGRGSARERELYQRVAVVDLDSRLAEPVSDPAQLLARRAFAQQTERLRQVDLSLGLRQSRNRRLSSARWTAS